MKSFKQFIVDSEFKPHEVVVVTDIAFLQRHEAEIMKLIEDAYAPIGGYKGRPFSKNSAFDRVALAKLVFNSKQEIIALALYSADLGGKKRFCSAGIHGSEESREAATAIVQDDIEPYTNWYWVEASGTIEKLYKKFGGNPIPNHLAHRFLRKPAKDLILDPDGVHYTRDLGTYGKPLKKMIFGFKDEKYFDMTLKSVTNYDDFKKNINQAVEEILDEDEKSPAMKDLAAAVYICHTIEDWQDYGNLNELTPKMAKDLKIAKDKLETLSTDVSLSSENQELAKSNFKLATSILKNTPVLTKNQFLG